MKMNYITNGDQNVVLGSGYLYAVPFSDITDVFALTEAEEGKLVNLGYIEANAALKVAIEKIDLRAANAGRVGQITKERKPSFSTGIFSWNLKNISDFLTGSEFTEDTVAGTKTFTYGDGDISPNVYLRFVSEDETAKKRVIVNMFKGQFSGELTFDFNEETPITADYSFDLMSVSNNGKNNYFQIIEEDIPSV